MSPKRCAQTICALASTLLGGCAAIGLMAPCGEYPVFLSPNTNVVMLPTASYGSSFLGSSQSAFESALHLETMASLKRFEGTKVIRLTQAKTGMSQCQPDAVMRAWSGCNPGRDGRPMLVKRNPVVMLWANTYQDRDDRLIQFNMRMWLVGETDHLELLASNQDEEIARFILNLPPKQVVFPVRRLTSREMQRFQTDLRQEGLRAEPKKSAPTFVPERADLSMAVLEVKNVDEATWLRLELGDGIKGWVQMTDRGEMLDRFPELAFLQLATAYFEYLKLPSNRHVDYAEKTLALYEDLEEELTEELQASLQAGRELVTTMLLLEGFRRDRKENFMAAKQLIARMDEKKALQARLANLGLMADFGLCCTTTTQPRLSATPRVIGLTAQIPAVPWLETHFRKLAHALTQDPTDMETGANILAVLRLLTKSGILEVDGIDLKRSETRLVELVSPPKPQNMAELCKKAG